MSRLNIIFLFAFLVTMNSWAQNNHNYKVTYQTKIIKPQKKNNTKEDKTISAEEKAANRYKEIIFNDYLYSMVAISELKIIENQSTYKTRKTLDEDEIKASVRNFFNSITKNSGEYYYNLKTNEELLAKNTFGKDFLIFNQRNSISWTITKDKKTICNFICYKATATLKVKNAVNKGAKKKVTVWFTQSIPVSFGPFDYSGLPGLILEVNVTSNYGSILTTANKVDLNVKELKIKAPTKGKKVSLEEYEKISRNLLKKGSYLN